MIQSYAKLTRPLDMFLPHLVINTTNVDKVVFHIDSRFQLRVDDWPSLSVIGKMIILQGFSFVLASSDSVIIHL